MKPIFFLVIALSVLLHSPVRGVVLVQESFDYSGSQLNQADGGIGWRTAWQSTAQLNTSSVANLGSAGLDAPGNYPVGGGRSLMLNDPGGQISAFRGLATNSFIDFDTDGTYYLSFLAQKTSGSFVFRLSQGASTNVLSFTVATGGAVTMGLGSEQATSGTLIANNHSYLFVAKIVTSASEPDQVFFQRYSHTQDLPLDEPQSWLLQLSADLDLLGERIALFGGSNRTVEFDEIRIGTTWDSVVVPEPAAYASLVGLLSVLVVWGRRRLMSKREG